MNAEFFATLKEWSRYKHIILEKYLRVWVFKLGSTHRDLAFVDGFAGEGIYGDGKLGSPVIAAQWNDHPAVVQRRGRVLVIACETNEESAARLENALLRWRKRVPECAQVITEPFEDALPSIAALTRGMPTLFFLDPFGITKLTPATLSPILGDRERASTEILMRVDPKLFARYAGWLTRTKRDTAGTRHAATIRGSLDELGVGETAAELMADPEGPTRGEAQAVLFDKYLEIFHARFRYVQLIPIRPEYFGRPKYHLVHGTDNPDGATKINDVLSTTEDDLFETSERRWDGPQLTLFAPARVPRFAIRDAEDVVVAALEDGPLNFVEVSALLAIEFGPDFREKHHRLAVKQLVAQGRVRVDSPGAGIDRNTILTRVR